MRVQLHLLLITDLFLVLEPAPRGGFRYRPATPNCFAAFGNIWLDANGTFSATDNLIGGNCTLNIGWVDSVYASGIFLQ